MGKIIDINSSKMPEKSKKINIKSALLDYEIKTWKHKSQKRWNSFMYRFTMFWAYLCVVLIIFYCTGLISIPVTHFVSLLSVPFIPLIILRVAIFRYLFNKAPDEK